VASGLAAVAEAQEVEADRAARRKALEAQRSAVRSTIAGLREVGREVSEMSALVDGLFNDAMTYCGYYRHHREWRRRGSKMSSPAPNSKAIDDAIDAERTRRLFEAAGGDVGALFERLGGRLAKRVRERLVKRLSDSQVVRETFRRDAGMLLRDLEGEKPTSIERLVAERVVVGWLNVAWADVLCDAYSADLDDREVAAHVTRMRSAANRDYLASLKALALIRRAAPSVTVNVKATVKVRKGRGAGTAGGRLDRLGSGRN